MIKRMLCLPVCLLLLIVCSNLPVAEAQSLADVKKVDASYRYRIVGEHRVGACQAYVVEMTSQTWRGKPWKHWLSILVPAKVTHQDAAVLFITGGSSRSGQPKPDSGEARLMSYIATLAQSPIVILQQVPNQPLQGNRYEDDLIALTFDKFVKNEGDDWPLLLPMVESAVRAMDTTAAVMKAKQDQAIKRFVVSGASKRGWTTWLTAAADERVVAIAPMVIDVLNMQPQMEQQVKSYGKYSRMIQPYLEFDIPNRMKTKRGQLLTNLVDPYAYREKLTLPKLIILGTNDPYWTVDASSLYFPSLSGPKHLYYLANAGHGLGAQIAPTMAYFFKKSLDGETLSAMKWEVSPDGRFRAKWRGEGGQAKLWKATSKTRDFRESKWTSQPLEGANGVVTEVPEPDQGWAAYYIEVEFPGLPLLKYSLTTEIQVFPKRFPFPVERK
jgi:PhoPQ-activated pathogenicity-related protein